MYLFPFSGKLTASYVFIFEYSANLSLTPPYSANFEFYPLLNYPWTNWHRKLITFETINRRFVLMTNNHPLTTYIFICLKTPFCKIYLIVEKSQQTEKWKKVVGCLDDWNETSVGACDESFWGIFCPVSFSSQKFFILNSIRPLLYDGFLIFTERSRENCCQRPT